MNFYLYYFFTYLFLFKVSHLKFEENRIYSSCPFQEVNFVWKRMRKKLNIYCIKCFIHCIFSGASFAEALGMISPAKSKKKLLKDVSSPSNDVSKNFIIHTYLIDFKDICCTSAITNKIKSSSSQL